MVLDSRRAATGMYDIIEAIGMQLSPTEVSSNPYRAVAPLRTCALLSICSAYGQPSSFKITHHKYKYGTQIEDESESAT